MPTKTLKNKKSGTRIFKYAGSPVPLVLRENRKKGITYKLPVNLLQPRNLLRAKQKNKANAAKLADEVRRTKALEAERARRERLESQARFAAMLRAERERQAAESVFQGNNEVNLAAPAPRRGPGVRGTRTIPPNLLRMMRGESAPKALLPQSTNHPNVVRLLGNLGTSRTVRKANLLRAQHAAATRKPMGKFWKKEGTNNSNSSNSD